MSLRCHQCGNLRTPGALFCRTCGAAVAPEVAAAISPPNDETRVKEYSALRMALVVLAAFAAILIYAYTEGEKLQEADARTVPMGVPILAGDLTWTGAEAHTQSVLKSENTFAQELVTRGKYVVVDVKVENVGAQPASPRGYSLTDGQGREYENMWAALYTPGSYHLRELNPGLSQTGRLIFEAPSDADGFVLRVRGAEAGIALGF